MRQEAETTYTSANDELRIIKEKKKMKETKLPKYFIPAWSTQGISYAVAFFVLGYITYYCTNSLGMDPFIVGVVLLISKIFDGVTDLIAAVIIERTNTKWGKGRPYVLLMIVGWIFTILLFSAPEMGTVGQVFYIFTGYFIVNSICITLVNAAEPVYLARSLENTESSSTVLSISGLITSLVTMIIGIIFPLLITNVTVTEYGWTKVMLMFGIPCMILSFIRFAVVKERKDLPYTVSDKTKKFGFKDMLTVLKNNPHVIALVVVQILANVFSGMGSAVGTYYFQYIMGDINLASIVGLASAVGMLTIVFAPALIKRYSVKKVMMLGIVLGVIGNVIRIVPNLLFVTIGNVLTSIAVIPTGMLLPSLLIDCMDYNEWKTGDRVEAIFGSLNAFAMKLGGGLASVLVGIVMGITGFDAALEMQSTMADMGIIALYAVIPAIMFVIMLFVLRLYKIDEEMPKVKAELAAKRNS